LTWRGHSIDLGRPFARQTMVELVAEKTGLDLLRDPLERLKGHLATRQVEIPPYAGRGHLIEALFDHEVQPHLIQPTFVMDHPREISPLAKAPDSGHLVECQALHRRVENAFSDWAIWINAAVSRRARLRTMGERRRSGRGLPGRARANAPAAGIWHRVDRVACS
jgi:lysyl-tRNA synthetase class 2